MPTTTLRPIKIAVIDMGSNSFRLLIGQFENTTFKQTEYLKETVRQGSLDDEGNITPDAFERGLDCLARFKERLMSEPFDFIKIVATHTLREATNRLAFIQAAERVLEQKIEVISGQEEARLIFSGVTHLLPPAHIYRTAIDIGGRSTELVSGKGTEASELESYPVGSVAVTQKYFAEGKITLDTLKQAKLGIIASLNHAEKRFNRYIQKGEIWGCSGTIGAVYTIIETAEQKHLEPLYHGAKCISKNGMDYIRAQLLQAKNIQHIAINGLKAERSPIFIGGFAVLDALFDLFALERVYVSDGALRHGVIYDLLEREDAISDRRHQSVQQLAKKFNVDSLQAENVATTAEFIWQQLLGKKEEKKEAKKQDKSKEKDEDAELTVHPALNAIADAKDLELLDYAAELHELGGKISHKGIHKHGAYVLQNTELVGFYQSEQDHIALLVLASRGKLKNVLPDHLAYTHLLQIIALRFAIKLCHARRQPDFSALQFKPIKPQHIVLRYHAHWANEHPQSFYLIQEEVQHLAKADIVIELESFS